MDVNFLCEIGQSKVRDACLAFFINHDIGRFEVAVKDAVGIRSRQARADLTANIDCFFMRQPARRLRPNSLIRRRRCSRSNVGR